MHYFKRSWDETPGDEYDSWGCSMWYFEVGEDGFISRQVEVYENGKILAYDELRWSDKFGMLSDKPLDIDELAPYTIHQEEFYEVWSKVNSGKNDTKTS